MGGEKHDRTSRALRRYRSGDIDWNEYLALRWESTLRRLSHRFDAGDLGYLRVVWTEYLENELSHTGAYGEIRAALRVTRRAGKYRKGEVQVKHSESTAKQTGEAGSDDLAQLERGEITMDEYVERRFLVALESQPGLSPEQREEAKKILLESFASDPVLRHYASIAAGKPSEL